LFASVFLFCVFIVYFLLVVDSLIFKTSAINCLWRLIFELTSFVLMVTLNSLWEICCSDTLYFFVVFYAHFVLRLHVCHRVAFRSTLRCAYVHRPSAKLFDFNDIWHVDRGQCVMHDGMQYDLIQGQGHESFKVGNPAIFITYFLCHLQWDIWPSICVTWLEVGRNGSYEESTVSPVRVNKLSLRSVFPFISCVCMLLHK